MEIIAAIIGGIFSLLAAVIGFRLSRRKAEPVLTETKPKGLLGPEEAIICLLIDEDAELDKLWLEYLAEHSDDRLEIHLHKIDSYLSKHPEYSSGFVLKSLVIRAIEVRDKRHFNHSSNRPFLYRIIRLWKKWVSLSSPHRIPASLHVSCA